jgi:hypothetical protein
VLALLGLLLGFSFAIAGARHEARRELLVEEATQSTRPRAARNCCPNRTLGMLCSWPSPITASFIATLNETFDLEGKRIAANRFLSDSVRSVRSPALRKCRNARGAIEVHEQL